MTIARSGEIVQTTVPGSTVVITIPGSVVTSIATPPPGASIPISTGSTIYDPDFTHTPQPPCKHCTGVLTTPSPSITPSNGICPTPSLIFSTITTTTTFVQTLTMANSMLVSTPTASIFGSPASSHSQSASSTPPKSGISSSSILVLSSTISSSTTVISPALSASSSYAH